MEQSYTQNTLIKYLYNDADICERVETECLINTVDSLRISFAKFKDTSNKLSEIDLAPRALTLAKLKAYSQIEHVQYN